MKLFLIGVLLCVGVNANASFILSFDSTPQSWVGQGESFTVAPSDDFIFRHRSNFDNGLTFDVLSLNSPFGPDWNPGSGERYNYWTLDLSAPFDAALMPGFYGDTARWPFQDNDQAGLTFSGNHRGNNRNGGFFNVLDISYLPSGDLDSFAVDFTQFGEESLDRRIDGKLRYNSNIPVSVPEPTSMWLMMLGVLGLIRKRSTVC